MDWLGQHLGASSSRNLQQQPPVDTTIPEHSNKRSEEVEVKVPSESDQILDLKNKLHQRTTELERLEEEHGRLTKAHQIAQQQNQGFETWALQLGEELETMRQLNKNLQQDLQACRDDLFTLQPVAQAPDSDIAQSYDDLNEHISSWMEGVIARCEARYRERHDGRLPKLFRHGGVPAVAEFLDGYPTFGGEFLVRCFMQNLLQRMIFGGHILLLGLDTTATALLRSIEQSMVASKPPRDPGSIKTWLSEALCALQTTANYQQSSRKANLDLLNQIFDEMARYFPVVKEEGGNTILWESVIRPAVTLAKKIQSSPTRYEFVPTVASLARFQYCNVQQNRLSNNKLIDVVSRKTLKASSSIRTDEKGSIGTQIMILAPALYRCDPGKDPLLLVKETDLVKLHTPLGRRRAATLSQESGNGASPF
ncbi:MAG: hypothetical protein Q9169_000724 [Polycauliona sp. 2 TL-2023]